MLDAEAVSGFKYRLRGELLRPEDTGYDEARTVWNGMTDKRPGLIVRCAGPSDVIKAVNLARDTGSWWPFAGVIIALRATLYAMAAS